MALIIEHGGGSAEGGGVDGLAGFAQGFQRGQLVKAEEDRRKAAERRAKALHEASIRKQRIANEVARLEADHAPERLRSEGALRQGSVDQQGIANEVAQLRLGATPEMIRVQEELARLNNERVQQNLDATEVSNRIARATEGDTINGIRLGVEATGLKVKQARRAIKEVERVLRENAAVDFAVGEALFQRLLSMTDLPGADAVLTDKRIEVLAELSFLPGAGEALDDELNQVESELQSQVQRNQVDNALAYISQIQENAEAIESGDSDLDAGLYPTADEATAWAELIKSGADPSDVVAKIEDALGARARATARKRSFDRTVVDLQAMLQEAEKGGAFKGNAGSDRRKQANELLVKVEQMGAKKDWEGLSEHVRSLIDPEYSQQTSGAFRAGYGSAADDFSRQYNEREEFWENNLDEISRQNERQVRQLQRQLDALHVGMTPGAPPPGPKSPVGPAEAGGGAEAYDMESAEAAGLERDETGHMPSRVPSGAKEGLILKDPDHPTFWKTVQGEKDAGMEWYHDPKDDKWYTFPQDEWPTRAGLIRKDPPVTEPKAETDAEAEERLSQFGHYSEGSEGMEIPRVGRISAGIDKLLSPIESIKEALRGPGVPVDSQKPASMSPDVSAGHWKRLRDLPDDATDAEQEEALLGAIEAVVKSLEGQTMKMRPDELFDYVKGALGGRDISMPDAALKRIIGRLDAKKGVSSTERRRGSFERLSGPIG